MTKAKLTEARKLLDSLEVRVDQLFLKDLESDMIFLGENPTPQEVRDLASKWRARAAEVQS